MSDTEAWAKLLALLDDDPAAAGPAYEVLRVKLVKFFSWKGCADAEQLADQVFDRVARKLDEGDVRVEDPARYVLGVARLIYLETVKTQARQRRALDRAAAAGAPDASEAGEVERRLRMLEACLDGLSEADRQLVLRYHEGSGQSRIAHRRELAEELGVAMNALRIRLHRMRSQLEDCVRDKSAKWIAGRGH